MLFDTHCHLNFKAFSTKGRSLSGRDGKVEEIIKRAKDAGVSRFIVPGTDVETSKKAVELAEKFPQIYAAVGIHPHHVFQVQSSKLKIQNYSSKLKIDKKQVAEDEGIPTACRSGDIHRQSNPDGKESSDRPRFLIEIEELLKNEKVKAVGEVGLDMHIYQQTKYENYQIDEKFIELQKLLFIEQIKLAIRYKKSLIIHSREAVGETLKIIGEPSFVKALAGRAVFHCCEAEDRLLEFAIAHHIYIGVDGDVTYSSSKIEFVKKIPLELLVLETDSPFLLPEPLLSQKKFLRLRPVFGGTSARQANEPKNLMLIAQKISEIKKTPIKHLIKVTIENSKKLFNIHLLP